MRKMEIGITRRSETRPSDTATADLPYFRQEQEVGVETGREPLGVPARFRVLSEVGHGGMGVVYKVRDLEADEIVALKLLKPEVSSNPKLREELRQEVCLARKVTHKNVCRIHELYRSATASCISMEFISGETLLSRLHRDGALPTAETIAIARQICAGLREAHLHRIVHRDLKPGNIMIDASGVVKIMDFGIARRTQENDHSTTTIAGTPEYMAPEQIELKAMGPRTDIYAVGLLLYEMSTGTRAFTGETTIAVALKQLRESPKRPSEIVPAIPLGLEAVILKCLRKNAESRFQSVDNLDAALSKPAAAKAPAIRTIVLPAVRMDAAVRSVREKWQQLRQTVHPLARKVGRGARRLGLLAEIKFKQLVLMAVAITPRTVRTSRTIQAVAGAAVVLPGIALFSMVAGNFNRHDAVMSHGAISPSVQTLQTAGPSLSSGAAPSTTSDTVVITRSLTEVATAPDPGTDTVIPPSDDSGDDLPAASSPAQIVSQPNLPKPAPTKQKWPKAVTSASRLAANKSVGATNPVAAAKTTVHDSAEVQASGVVAKPVLAAAPATLQPADPATDAHSDSSKSEAGSVTYLEVGSFKEAKWADDAVERLTQLGFHAICVHKTMLWKLQSYHVQVGPYTTSSDIGVAQEKLTAQGFRPHPVK